MTIEPDTAKEEGAERAKKLEALDRLLDNADTPTAVEQFEKRHDQRWTDVGRCFEELLDLANSWNSGTDDRDDLDALVGSMQSILEEVEELSDEDEEDEEDSEEDDDDEDEDSDADAEAVND